MSDTKKFLGLVENWQVEWADEMREMGLSDDQIKYMLKADELVKSGKHISGVDDVEMELGYGVVDKAMLRDTFFKG